MMDKSLSVHVSVVSIYEIAQKVRLAKWPEMAPVAALLSDVFADQGYTEEELTGAMARLAGLLDWHHRDPFDRMIATTAIVLKLPLISADTAFDALSGRGDWPGRVR